MLLCSVAKLRNGKEPTCDCTYYGPLQKLSCRLQSFCVSECAMPVRSKFNQLAGGGKLGEKGGHKVQLARGKDASKPSVGSVLDLLRA